MQQNYTNRIAHLRTKLANSAFDAILISGTQNCRYLSGFENNDSNVAFLIINHQQLILITDYRYAQQAKKECPHFEIIERNRQHVSLGEEISRVLSDFQCSQLAFERDHLGFGMAEDIIAEIKAFDTKNSALADCKVKGVSGWIESLRMIRDESEIASTKAAASISDAAFNHFVSILKPGITERDASLELEYQMQKLGSEGLSFATIFLAGARTSLPHGMPSAKKLEHGDLVTLDFGAVVNGYRSDMTRAFVVGEPSEKQAAVYETVKQAQQIGLDSVKAGILGSTPYFETKKILDASPFAQYQGEGLGHGVGLSLHEQPFLDANCNIMLEENMVITIEPGIYIPDWGGVRIEDDILVTKEGSEVITLAPRDLIVIE